MSSKAAKKKTDKKKKGGRFIKWTVIGVVLFIAWFWYMASLPPTGSAHVGVCRAYAELQIRYPSTLRLTRSFKFDRSQRLHFTYIDPFGNTKSSRIECEFKYPLSTNNLEIENIYIDRVPEPREKVELHNKSIPAILAADPDLTVPWPPGDNLRDLYQERR